MIKLRKFQSRSAASQRPPGWVSILGDDYGWGNVVEEAENVSSLTDSPVLSVGYFDDDVLELTVAVNGETIATHVAGPGLDVYELDAGTADAETLIRSLQLTADVAKLREILADPSIEDTVMRLPERTPHMSSRQCENT
ncbi:hypothetical protein [Paenibacillus oceani]|uniref:Uncharacterized protein n=1 Tax=Paenibacillus oceani TaxID=2772510 RepID=A0A927GZU6_9BACL|nr:hypothetical protein [Paenibacillus oceani]MBD2862457.1 hypothetical protein [Paenibacillus oceani]